MTYGHSGTGFVVLRHPQHLTFVCDACKEPSDCDSCRNGPRGKGTWCDCGHRAPQS